MRDLTHPPTPRHPLDEGIAALLAALDRGAPATERAARRARRAADAQRRHQLHLVEHGPAGDGLHEVECTARYGATRCTCPPPAELPGDTP